jgi:hypothetical protein
VLAEQVTLLVRKARRNFQQSKFNCKPCDKMSSKPATGKISSFLASNCIQYYTSTGMPFIRFSFIEVPKELLPIVGQRCANFFTIGGASNDVI